MLRIEFESLESRRLFSIGLTTTPDLLVDTNRDGVINSLDNKLEGTWTSGKTGQGAVILPNFDKDNAVTGGAPDNWTGGVWNGRPAAPNNVIDNGADLLDVGRLRMRMLNTDASYDYRVTLQLIKPSNDPAWFASTPASSRVRVFFPTKQQTNGDVVPQAGDVAVMGPGLGDTIRFVVNPAAPNEYNIAELAGDGWFEFGVEGLKAGAGVRFKLTVEHVPIIISSQPPGSPALEPTEPSPAVIDEVAMRVAPFVLSDNRQAADKVIIENMNRYGIDNAEARAAIKQVFGTRMIESKSGDIWQQDGYEIGYVRSPYGQMPVVLELPRARDFFFDGQNNMRSFVRGTLLKANLGVSTELAALAHDSASAFGGDIESLPRPGAPAGAPGFLLASGMPKPMSDFFAAQGVNPMLNLKLDDWLGVAHVDEVVQLAPNGKHVLVADPDLAWALALWAVKINPNVRMHPGMNSNESLPGYTSLGVKVASILANATFRKQNLEFAQNPSRLRGVVDTVRKALGLTDEVSAPVRNTANTGTVALARGGAFARMLGSVKRTFEVRFLDADRYELRYRDDGKASSKWFAGLKSRDEVFTEARAFVLKNYWTGTAKAGDRFTFATNPSATFVKVPQMFGSFGVLHDPPNTPPPPEGWRLAPYSTNHINALVDRATIVTGKAYGPKVNWTGAGSTDLFEDYTSSAFRAAGYSQIVFTDSRLYHDSGGNLHCGTNVIRFAPSAKWWEA